MVAKVFSIAILGLEGSMVEVEVDVSNGLPSTSIVGLPGTAVQESRERVKSAIKNSSFQYPLARISVNLAPAHLPKVGTRYDLPIAIGILAASRQLSYAALENTIFIGELSLDGKVREVEGIIAALLKARELGFKKVFIPLGNGAEASLVKRIESYGVESLGQVVRHFAGKVIQSVEKKVVATADAKAVVDFANIAGQLAAKRALEIAAAGGHNIILSGPPGTGKTMLAQSLPGILPPLSEDEALEVANINSVAGNWNGADGARPFRSPHHTTSHAAIIGGGTVPHPGEITLAHRGVLFLDELPEFARPVLEALRQPIEQGSITLTRGNYTVKFPSEFMLAAAYNPCPCGYYNDSTSRCRCSANDIARYQKKLSGPLLDRIDLKITVPRIEYSELARNEGETSAQVKLRVAKARCIQHKRFKKVGKLNSNMSPGDIKEFCKIGSDSHDLLGVAVRKFHLSGRSIMRTYKTARTIADLGGRKNITRKDIAEALHFRLGE